MKMAELLPLKVYSFTSNSSNFSITCFWLNDLYKSQITFIKVSTLGFYTDFNEGDIL